MPKTIAPGAEDLPPRKIREILLKAATNGIYDFQKMRIMAGNRLVAQFKAKLGYKPGTKEGDSIDDDGMDIIEEIKKEYKKITDGVKDRLPTKRSFKASGIISDYGELLLLDQYIKLEAQEASAMRRIKDLVEDHPIWSEFLSAIEGVGPLSAAAIIGGFDIRKAKYPSSLWKYAGFDVVQVAYRRGGESGKDQPVASFSMRADKPIGAILLEDPTAQVFKDLHGEDVGGLVVRSEGRVKKNAHLVTRQMKDDEGNVIKVWRAAGYNPWLKSRLWNMAGCMKKACIRWVPVTREEFDSLPESMRGIRPKGAAGEKKADALCKRVCDQKYVVAYVDYKHRLENRPDWKDKTPAHREAAATRYMIKLFLADLYVAWRTLEGLPVAPSYAESKLGIVHGTGQNTPRRQ